MRGERDLYREKIEVSLDGKQVFYLFFGGAVIASLVFVVGVMVGKRLESRAHVDAESAETARHDPLAALDMLAAGGADEELSFPDALREPRADAPVRVGVAKPDEAASKAAEEAKAAALKAEAEKKKADEAKKADEEKKKKAEAAKKAAKAEEEKKKKKAEASKERFTLQLSSFQSESEAETFYNRLRNAGYKPYISRAEVPGKGTWFRVRLGKYSSYEDAVAAKGNFEKRQNIIAYVTRLR